MLEKYDYNNKTHTGATKEDCMQIHLALSRGDKLTIDPEGHIRNSDGRWIADGKPRGTAL